MYVLFSWFFFSAICQTLSLDECSEAVIPTVRIVCSMHYGDNTINYIYCEVSNTFSDFLCFYCARKMEREGKNDFITFHFSHTWADRIINYEPFYPSNVHFGSAFFSEGLSQHSAYFMRVMFHGEVINWIGCFFGVCHVIDECVMNVYKYMSIFFLTLK